ncbi:putative transcription factor interactor and regulator CCHC(Zn) family [Rosa chinensis]|uniref:Putative transcription factor interactor and regulator CCHC(Zn) family n=1 Tax=Rosa chinensis TaxID=74649 RepID=A0A2P6R1X7_ROSCH|nr:putative transcription factor interactor and regulator CCHC(Zn) family [Rosa chinensis]
MEDPLQVSLRSQYLWVRVRGLSSVYLEDTRVVKTGRVIGQAIGQFIHAKRGVGALGVSLRIRVGIDVGVSLKKWVIFQPVGWPESKRFDLEYERLPHFCFFCGLMSHTGRSCPRRVAGELTEPAYDALLNAERKEEWLLAQQRPSLYESTSTGEGCRFGLIPRRRTGWIMEAPEMLVIGLTRTREERDENEMGNEGAEGEEMEVESPDGGKPMVEVREG